VGVGLFPKKQVVQQDSSAPEVGGIDSQDLIKTHPNTSLKEEALMSAFQLWWWARSSWWG